MASVTGWEVFGKVWNILSMCWKQSYLGKLWQGPSHEGSMTGSEHPKPQRQWPNPMNWILLDHGDSRMDVSGLPGKEVASGRTMGGRHAGRGRVVLWDHESCHSYGCSFDRCSLPKHGCRLGKHTWKQYSQMQPALFSRQLCQTTKKGTLMILATKQWVHGVDSDLKPTECLWDVLDKQWRS